jgi:fatty acid-binding protein DegV
MTVKIVTDSVADLPSQVVKELDITVISILVRWGEELYRDGIDLTAEQFYSPEGQSSTGLPVGECSDGDMRW